MAAAVAQPFKISSVFAGAAAAVVFSTDEEAACCLCLEGDSDKKPLLQVRVCSCKGSIRFHRDCVFEMAKHNPKCGACKKTLLNPDYIGLYYDADDPELIGAKQKTDYYPKDVYGILHSFYHINETDAIRRHGICKVFYEQHSGYYAKSTIPLTIYEVKHYDNGILHGPYKRWSHFEHRGIQYPEVEATYDQGLLRGPFKIYDPYRDGRLRITGTLHSTDKKKPSNILPFGTDALYIGEYKLDEGGRWGITYHCAFKEPCKMEYIFAHDRAGFAAFASRLADGQHTIPYITFPDTYGKPGKNDGRIAFNVSNGLMEGPWTATLFSGDVVEQRHYNAGKCHGPYKRFHYSSMQYNRNTEMLHGIVEEGLYVHGKRHGRFVFNYADEEGKTRLVANYKHGVRIGQQTLYDRDGCIVETTTLAQDGSGFLDGPAVFYEQGHIVQRCSFRQDKLHGKMTLYMGSGMPWLQIVMEHGKLRGGSWISHYDKTGALDKAASERVKPEGDYLASLEDLDNYMVRSIASTDGDVVLPSYVEVRDEPEMHWYINDRTGKLVFCKAGEECKCDKCLDTIYNCRDYHCRRIYEMDEDEYLAAKALHDQASVDSYDDYDERLAAFRDRSIDNRCASGRW